VTAPTTLPMTLPAMITPFDREGRLDPSRYRDYVPWLEHHGVDGLFAFGTTGEGLTLTVEERERGLEALMRVARQPVMVHVGAMALADTRRLLRHAEDHGALAAAVVSPPYYEQDGEALVAYYTALADDARIPLLLYNIPSRAISDMSPPVAARLHAVASHYVGIKDSSRNPSRLALYHDAGLRVWVGAESLVQMSALFGEGSITAMAAAFPDLVVACATEAGTPSGATRQARVVSVHGSLKGPSIQALREVLRVRGVDLGPPRLPFRALTPAEAASAVEAARSVSA
jgi:4-hydroxy-tetrahydrodipicolinate synthase